MKQLRGASTLGARQTWLWRHRGRFGETSRGDRPRLFVDVSAIIRHDAQTGIQRVVRAVWSELKRRDGAGFQLVPVFAGPKHGYCYAHEDSLQSGALEMEGCPVRMREGDRFLGLDLSAHLLPKFRPQLRAWRAHGATVHLVVYDLLPLQRPAWFTSSAVNHFRKWVEILAHETDQALCISDQVAADVRQCLHERGVISHPRINRLRLGSDIAASVPSRGTSEDLGEALARMRFRPTVLMVGTIEPRKGYEAALAAFERLWLSRADAPDLVMVGKAGWKTEDLQSIIRSHAEFGRRMHWFDQMSDEGLCLLYEASRAVLMASRGEGWGLPLIEAATHRRHVLARDLPVFREHGLSNVIYFGDDSPAALGEKILEVVSLGQHAAPAADLPTWSDCVDGLLDELGLPRLKSNCVEQALRKAS